CRSPRVPRGSCGTGAPRVPALRRSGHSCWFPRSCGNVLVAARGLAARRLPDAELPLTHHGVDAGDVALDAAQPAVALELAGRRLEAQAEQLLLRLTELGLEVHVGHVVEIVGGRRHQNSPLSRVTNLHFMGSL